MIAQVREKLRVQNAQSWVTIPETNELIFNKFLAYRKLKVLVSKEALGFDFESSFEYKKSYQ